MKKIITLSLMLVTLAFSATFASAQSYIPQQERYNQNRRINNRGVRITTQTRIVRQGFRTYRETIQVKRFPNGKVTTKVISRTRIR